MLLHFPCNYLSIQSDTSKKIPKQWVLRSKENKRERERERNLVRPCLLNLVTYLWVLHRVCSIHSIYILLVLFTLQILCSSVYVCVRLCARIVWCLSMLELVSRVVFVMPKHRLIGCENDWINRCIIASQSQRGINNTPNKKT